MNKKQIEMICRWLEEANNQLDKGCDGGNMHDIPFDVDRLDTAQLLIRKVIEVIRATDENHK